MLVDAERRGNLGATTVEMSQPCMPLGEDEGSNVEPIGMFMKYTSTDSQPDPSRFRKGAGYAPSIARHFLQALLCTLDFRPHFNREVGRHVREPQA